MKDLREHKHSVVMAGFCYVVASMSSICHELLLIFLAAVR